MTQDQPLPRRLAPYGSIERLNASSFVEWLGSDPLARP